MQALSVSQSQTSQEASKLLRQCRNRAEAGTGIEYSLMTTCLGGPYAPQSHIAFETPIGLSLVCYLTLCRHLLYGPQASRYRQTSGSQNMVERALRDENYRS